MKTISDYGTKFREIIKANAPVAYGGTKYLMVTEIT